MQLDTISLLLQPIQWRKKNLPMNEFANQELWRNSLAFIEEARDGKNNEGWRGLRMTFK
jgi:hypothetical protein